MKFGLNLHLNSPAQMQSLPKLAKIAEEHSFSQLWWANTNFNYADPYLSLTVCALNTSHIRSWTAATNPITRHPATTNIAMTLDVASNDGFILT